MVTNIFYVSPCSLISCAGVFISLEDFLPTYTAHLAKQHLGVLPFFFLFTLFSLTEEWPATVHTAPPFQCPTCHNFLHILSISALPQFVSQDDIIVPKKKWFIHF